MRRHRLRGLAPWLSALFLTPAVLAQEAVRSGQRLALSETRLEVFTASGTVTLRRGNELSVTATAAGPDGQELRFFVDREGGSAVFRVVFPEDADQIAAPEGLGGQRTNLRLRADGTFGGDDGDHANDAWWRRLTRARRGGDVEIGGRGGFRGWANVEVTVPDNRTLRVHLAVGRVAADGVNGDVFVDTWSAGAIATGIAGSWLFDTGSGDVEVRGSRGTLRIDTGSGSADVTDVAGDLLDVDTGSGSVDATNVQVERFRFDTGSGDVRATNLTARRGVADTGSGSVTLAYGGGAVDDLVVDTGSGSVRLTLPADVDARVSIDTGSGGINVARGGAIFERRDSEGMVLRFGEGRGRIRIDTGSGSVTLR
jgi:hypothetical protein